MEIFDIVSALAMVIHCEELQREVVKQLELDAFLEFYRCIRHINIAVHKIFGDNCLVFIDALFNLHQCVRIRPCKAMDFLGDCYSFVHRTSLIAN